MSASVNHIFPMTDSFSLRLFNYVNMNSIKITIKLYQLPMYISFTDNMVFIKLSGTVNVDITFLNFELNST